MTNQEQFREVIGRLQDIRQRDRTGRLTDELIANAVRASGERGAAEPVAVDVACDGDRVRFRVSDSAGGFDPRRLPYDIFHPDSEIDPTSEAFERYREEHDESRFGLGLLLARRAVEEFRLRFVDHEGNETSWRDDGSVRGTVVSFSMKMRGEA